MEEKLIARLLNLGYTYNETTDATLLEFATESSQNRIKVRINQSDIPDELENIEIDMICAEFLMVKKSCGQLDSFDFEKAVSSIKEGDTQVSFTAEMSAEQKFDAMLDRMINGNTEDFIRYRKLVW